MRVQSRVSPSRRTEENRLNPVRPGQADCTERKADRGKETAEKASDAAASHGQKAVAGI